MRSLRARIFLTVWPLFVAAILVVGALSNRSARIKLEQFEQRMSSTSDEARMAGMVDRVAALWPTLREANGTSVLQRLATEEGDSLDVLVLDTTGALVASSDHSVAAKDLRMQANGSLDLTRTLTRGRDQQLQRLLLMGSAVTNGEGIRLGFLYRLPGGMPQPTRAQVMVAGIQRSLWLTILLACVMAAVGTWLLAYPLVAQVRRLTLAASGVQDKALSTRVRVSSQDELGALEQSFNRMAESLEQTEFAKRQMITDLAHELRTPLTNVIGLLEAMRDGLRAPNTATLHSVHEEALLLKQLIDELQELALADAGQLHFTMSAVDARTAVQRAAEAFQAVTPSVRLVLPDTPLWVEADARRLAQVLRNVLQNAVTHTPNDGAITMTVMHHGHQVQIDIADTGRGIAADHLPLIWERFYRVDASRDRATGGMGLGLALTKRMMEGMGGSIGITSVEGAGTTVTLHLRSATAAT